MKIIGLGLVLLGVAITLVGIIADANLPALAAWA